MQASAVGTSLHINRYSSLSRQCFVMILRNTFISCKGCNQSGMGSRKRFTRPIFPFQPSFPGGVTLA